MFLSPPRSPPPLNVTSVLLQKHPFFRHINWEELLARRLDPPFKPCLVPGMLWGAMGLKGGGGGAQRMAAAFLPPHAAVGGGRQPVRCPLHAPDPRGQP